MLLLAALLSLLAAVSSSAKLAIGQAAVERYEDGPPALRDDTFLAGEEIHFSFVLEGFARKDSKVDVLFDAQPLDGSDVPLTTVFKGKESSALSPEDKDWKPKLRGHFLLPPVLLPGGYHITIHVTDQLAGASVSKNLPFEVAGPPVKPSTTLAVQNLAFYRTEDAERPLGTAAFRLGEEIHSRFQIVGFKSGEGGAMDVSYGLAVTDKDGHALIQETVASRDTSADFYSKPYVPGFLDLSLKPETPLGEYTLTVTATDAVGRQHAEARQTFRLE